MTSSERLFLSSLLHSFRLVHQAEWGVKLVIDCLPRALKSSEGKHSS